MATFVVLGVAGLVILALSLLVDDVLSFFEAGPGWLSGMSVGAFLGMFGAVGAVTFIGTENFGISMVAGFLAGALLGAVAHQLTRALNKDSKGAAYEPSDMVGLAGVTLHESPRPGALVQVRLTVAGHPVTVNARSGEALTSGQSVTVTDVISATQVSVTPN